MEYLFVATTLSVFDSKRCIKHLEVLMITRIASRIITIFERNNVMEHEKEIYQHGLELILSYISGLMVQIVFCLFTGFWLETLLFILFFETIRKYIGGYHASTYLECNVDYSIIYFIYYLIIKLVAIPDIVSIILFVVAALFIVVKAPVTHINNPLTKEEQLKYKHITMVIIGIYTLVFAALFFWGDKYLPMLVIPMVLNMIFLILGLLFNERGEA